MINEINQIGKISTDMSVAPSCKPRSRANSLFEPGMNSVLASNVDAIEALDLQIENKNLCNLVRGIQADATNQFQVSDLFLKVHRMSDLSDLTRESPPKSQSTR